MKMMKMMKMMMMYCTVSRRRGRGQQKEDGAGDDRITAQLLGTVKVVWMLKCTVD